MLELLNEYALLIKLIVGAGTLLATIILLYFNYQSNKYSHLAVREMQRAREEEHRPYVYFDVHFENNREMHFVLRNEGTMAALNVELELDQNLKVWNSLVRRSKEKDYFLQDMAIHDDIEMLAPGDEFKEWVDDTSQFFRNNDERRLTGRLRYEDTNHKKFALAIDLDLEPYLQRSQVFQKNFSDLVRSIENIRRRLRGF